jgi:serine/threonine-protein kinase HipA
MSERNCQICLEALGETESDYHNRCCRLVFGQAHPPKLPFYWEELNALAEKVVRSRIAIPGVQPKLSLHLERGGASAGGRFTIVGLEGNHILKPPVARYPEMPEAEHLTMRMARCFGIPTADCGLIALEDGKRCLIVRRMDRVGARKLAMEDMCQLTDRLTEEKYRGSLEVVGKAILRFCTNPGLEALKFFEVNVFCFLTGNADMHLKNFSLLRSARGEIELAPAYDLLPTGLLLPEDHDESALTLNEKKRRIGQEDFLAFGAAMKLTERQIENSFNRIDRGRMAAMALMERSFCSVEMVDRYRKLLSTRWERLLSPK